MDSLKGCLLFEKNPQCLLMDIADRGYYCADFEVGGQQQWFIGFTLTCDDWDNPYGEVGHFAESWVRAVALPKQQ